MHNIQQSNFLLIDRYIYSVGLVFGLVLSMSYYFFIKDKSESISIFIIYSTMLLTGLEDFMVYLFYGDLLNVPMSWLDGSLASVVPNLLNIPVTLYSVLANSLLFIFISIIISYILSNRL